MIKPISLYRDHFFEELCNSFFFMYIFLILDESDTDENGNYKGNPDDESSSEEDTDDGNSSHGSQSQGRYPTYSSGEIRVATCY